MSNHNTLLTYIAGGTHNACFYGKKNKKIILQGSTNTPKSSVPEEGEGGGGGAISFLLE